jgi:hypothetical protein
MKFLRKVAKRFRKLVKIEDKIREECKEKFKTIQSRTLSKFYRYQEKLDAIC